MKRYISMLLITITLFSFTGCTVSTKEVVDSAKSEISNAVDEAVDEAVNEAKKEANNWKDKNITQPLNNTKNSIKGFFSSMFKRHSRIVEDTTNNIVTIYNSKGEEIIEPDADTIAKAKYRKKFSRCNEKQRTDVIRLLLINRGVPSIIVDFISEIDTTESSIPLKKWEKLETFEEIITTAGTDFAILELYANIKDDKTAAKTFSALGEGVEFIENINSVVKSIFLFKGLANNELKDSTEYCTKLVEALGSVADIVGIDYFSESLEAVKVGVEVLLELYEKREQMYTAIEVALYGDEGNMRPLNNPSILTKDKWIPLTYHPNRWKDSDCPSLADIRDNYKDFIEITEEEHSIVQTYIIYRIQYELGLKK